MGKIRQMNLKLTGIDAAPAAINLPAMHPVGLTTLTMCKPMLLTIRILLGNHDIVISSLFTHHFDDERWVKAD
jgi:hypothetical protein